MSDKQKFPRAVALDVARELCAALAPVCEPGRLIVAGSLRRRKAEVGDVEIVYVTLLRSTPEGLFDTRQEAAVDLVLSDLLATGKIARRKSVTGAEAWGEKNKLAVHCASGIPVDLFATTEAAWFNYLVCRTGGKVNNQAIASAAQRKGWKWHPYGPGFTDHMGNLVSARSEAEVFELAGLPYLEPWRRL